MTLVPHTLINSYQSHHGLLATDLLTLFLGCRPAFAGEGALLMYPLVESAWADGDDNFDIYNLYGG